MIIEGIVSLVGQLLLSNNDTLHHTKQNETNEPKWTEMNYN